MAMIKIVQDSSPTTAITTEGMITEQTTDPEEDTTAIRRIIVKVLMIGTEAEKITEALKEKRPT